MEVTGLNEQIAMRASFSKTHDLSLALLETLQQLQCPVGYGLAACSLTIARLMNPTHRLTDEEEIQFVEDVMAYSGAYWGEEKGKVMQ